MRPYESRIEAWKRIATDLPMDKLESMVHSAALEDLQGLGKSVLDRAVKGRVVDVNA